MTTLPTTSVPTTSGPTESGPVKLVLATHNAHKVVELRRILGASLDGIELIAYDGPEPVEDGETFDANALIKARAASEHTGLPAIADDSGIAVAALGGAPGINSARYAGTRNDADNVRLLLANLVGHEERGAQFVCAAALVVPAPVGAVGPDGPAEDAASFEWVETGVWAGTVLHEAVGGGGFGYDPVFKPAGYNVSSAELHADEKNAISHRARAFAALMPVVRERLVP
ncbi:non-canonical purine NTP pyrophosphatase [Lacisediminihabitans sp.]|jgi:XTP/dITP diphosphohydrolase|uniref:non-canonical purine NTP pyrophosphatase n=1 Tax=Lacisediminihabitans sp. TaxID=2787631 RepID=UPI002F95DAF4